MEGLQPHAPLDSVKTLVRPYDLSASIRQSSPIAVRPTPPGNAPPLRPLATSPLDGTGADRTMGIPAKEAGKVWPQRSMKEMADYGTIPPGLPQGLTDSEKKLWMAFYVKARELLKEEGATVRSAVDDAVVAVTERGSLEYRFGIRWQHSVKTVLAMRQDYRSSDVYS